MILRKRRAKLLYDALYKQIDSYYTINKIENIHLESISFRPDEGIPNNIAEELYRDPELKEEVKKLFLTDGWKKFDVSVEHVPEVTKYDLGGTSWTREHNKYFIILEQ